METLSASNGVVSSGHPLATEAGVAVLMGGGNAVDAAVAASAVQCVVEMPWGGVGGDAFVTAHRPGVGSWTLNSSGRSPKAIESLIGRDEAVPRFGPASIAVPGLVAAWGTMLERFGTRTLDEVVGAAVAHARDGIPVDARLAEAIERIQPELAHYPALARLLGGNGRRVGERFVQPDLADTLATLAEEGPGSLYEGDLAEKVAAAVRERGGVLGADDLAAHRTEWLPPLSIDYRGRQVLQNPPVSLGLVHLQQLRMLERLDVSRYAPGSAELIHLMVACKKAAFQDAREYLGDPEFCDVPVDWLLSDERISWWVERLVDGGPEPAAWPELSGSDTTSVAVADRDGTTVGLIQSLFNEFGSRELVEGTGILLNDRLANLRRGDGTPNSLRGGQRPVHTLNAYLVLADGTPVLCGATPGGKGQVQTNFQVLVNVVDHGLPLQAAVDAPRWLNGTPRQPVDDEIVHLEPAFPAEVVERLRALGHEVRVTAAADDLFGSCTLVGRDPDSGTLLGAADARRDASASGW